MVLAVVVFAAGVLPDFLGLLRRDSPDWFPVASGASEVLSPNRREWCACDIYCTSTFIGKRKKGSPFLLRLQQRAGKY